jgi:Vitamin K-dependent gamma-carboxylase
MISAPDRLPREWSRFWFRPASAVNLAVARMLFAGTALWIVLSRPDLPSVLAFPQAIWRTVPQANRIRYLLVFDLSTERFLFVVLTLSLLLAVFGLWTRITCLLSGLLLYHFAPLETIVWTPDPYLRGLTLPTLGLIVLSFSAAGRALSPLAKRQTAPLISPEHRWPIRLLQLLLVEVYFFAALGKLRNAGLAWPSAQNMQGYLMAYSQNYGIVSAPSIGYRVAAHPALCSLIGWTGILFELLFPLALFSRRAAAILVAIGLLVHLGIAALMHIFFLDALLLLIFIDWSRRRTGETPAFENG